MLSYIFMNGILSNIRMICKTKKNSLILNFACKYLRYFYSLHVLETIMHVNFQNCFDT